MGTTYSFTWSNYLRLFNTMKNLSYTQIYKLYKCGGSLKDIPNKDIFNALKKNKLQVVLVYDENGKERIYNFISETGKFYKLV